MWELPEQRGKSIRIAGSTGKRRAYGPRQPPASAGADPGKYRPKGEVEEWMKKDPVVSYRIRLLEAGVAEATLDEIDAAAMATLDAATEEAKASGASAADATRVRMSRRLAGMGVCP